MDDRYRLNELAELVGATPRTIRFYIAEGLLPPPTGAGPAAVYTAGHRDRLLLIERLKERYLPLREIRRQIAPLTDAEVAAELRKLAQEQSVPGAPPGAAVPPSPADAVDYLDRILGRRAPPAPPPPAPMPSVPPLPPRQPAAPPLREEWERITLGDGVELHIRTDRRREWVVLDALIRQARRLLGYEL